MRISMILLAWLALGGWAAGAGAAPFAGGTFNLAVKKIEPLTIPIGSGVLGVGPSGMVSLTNTQVVVGTDVAIGVTNLPPITLVDVAATGNATGTLLPGAGPAANALGLEGPGLQVVAYGGFATLLAIPLSPIGVPGAIYTSMQPDALWVRFTGTGWTTGTAMLVVPATTLSGAATTPSTVTFAGSNGVVGGVGQVTFITPLLIRTNLAGDLPSVASLSFTFVPEPSSSSEPGSGTKVKESDATVGRSPARLVRMSTGVMKVTWPTPPTTPLVPATVVTDGVWVPPLRVVTGTVSMAVPVVQPVPVNSILDPPTPPASKVAPGTPIGVIGIASSVTDPA